MGEKLNSSVCLWGKSEILLFACWEKVKLFTCGGKKIILLFTFFSSVWKKFSFFLFACGEKVNFFTCGGKVKFFCLPVGEKWNSLPVGKKVKLFCLPGVGGGGGGWNSCLLMGRKWNSSPVGEKVKSFCLPVGWKSEIFCLLVGKKWNFLFACGEKVANGSCANPGYTNSVSLLTLHPKSGSHLQQSSVIISFLHPNPRVSHLRVRFYVCSH